MARRALGLFALLLFAGCNLLNRPPTASLAADPPSGTAPLGVTFTIQASDPDGDPLSCTLDFGDGQSLVFGCSGPIEHTYQSAGRYTATLTVDDGHGHTTTARATITVSEGYTIELFYVKAPSDQAIAQAFQDAKQRWETVITGDLPDVLASIPAGSCGNDTDYKTSVDDLLIFVSVGPIDGPGGILGQAGPCLLRPDSYLPYAGMMKFDEADLEQIKQNGMLKDVILHEMGHVLGIGTLWEWFGYLRYEASNCVDASDIGYTGPFGITEWRALGGDGDVPVENTGDEGTKCGHWREATFGNELMTGWINGSHQPLSRVTIGSLEDLGYQVSYAAADAYALPSGTTPQGAGFELKEILIHPHLP